MKVSCWLLLVVLAAAVCCTEGYAQSGKKKGMKTFLRPVVVRLSLGDTLLVNCDSVYAFNREADIVMRERLLVDDSLIARLTTRIAVGDSINRLKDSVIVGFRNINEVQNKSYDMLRTNFFQADSLVRASTANTDAALFYIKKVKATSFLACGLAGGVTGGFGIKQSGQDGFNWWPGFVVGTVIGVGIDWLIISVL